MKSQTTARTSPTSPAAQPDAQSIALPDIPHSGHLHFVHKLARAGCVDHMRRLMTFYCKATEQGLHPSPVLETYVRDATKAVLSGENASQVFGQTRDRAGRPQIRTTGIIAVNETNARARRKSMSESMLYRDWVLASDVKREIQAGKPLKQARSAVARRHRVSNSTVHRACKNIEKPNPLVEIHVQYFTAVDDSYQEFEAFLLQCSQRNDPTYVFRRWYTRSISQFVRFGSVASHVPRYETPELAWADMVVEDLDLARALMLRLEPRVFGECIATTPEAILKAAFVMGYVKARAATLRKGKKAREAAS